jgi:hypothetical protein
MVIIPVYNRTYTVYKGKIFRKLLTIQILLIRIIGKMTVVSLIRYTIVIDVGITLITSTIIVSVQLVTVWNFRTVVYIVLYTIPMCNEKTVCYNTKLTCSIHLSQIYDSDTVQWGKIVAYTYQNLVYSHMRLPRDRYLCPFEQGLEHVDSCHKHRRNRHDLNHADQGLLSLDSYPYD